MAVILNVQGSRAPASHDGRTIYLVCREGFVLVAPEEIAPVLAKVYSVDLLEVWELLENIESPGWLDLPLLSVTYRRGAVLSVPSGGPCSLLEPLKLPPRKYRLLIMD